MSTTQSVTTITVTPITLTLRMPFIQNAHERLTDIFFKYQDWMDLDPLSSKLYEWGMKVFSINPDALTEETSLAQARELVNTLATTILINGMTGLPFREPVLENEGGLTWEEKALDNYLSLKLQMNQGSTVLSSYNNKPIIPQKHTFAKEIIAWVESFAKHHSDFIPTPISTMHRTPITNLGETAHTSLITIPAQSPSTDHLNQIATYEQSTRLVISEMRQAAEIRQLSTIVDGHISEMNELSRQRENNTTRVRQECATREAQRKQEMERRITEITDTEQARVNLVQERLDTTQNALQQQREINAVNRTTLNSMTQIQQQLQQQIQQQQQQLHHVQDRVDDDKCVIL